MGWLVLGMPAALARGAGGVVEVERCGVSRVSGESGS